MASMIRCLHRDAEKYNKLNHNLENQQAVENDYKKKIRYAKSETEHWNKMYKDLCADIRDIYGVEFFNQLMRKRFSAEYINSHYNKDGEHI